MIYLKAEDFNIIGFYSYSTKIPDSCKIFKVNQKDSEDRQSFRRLEKFIGDLQRRASQISGEGRTRFEDNNVVWKLEHKVTGNIIFFGDSDWEYSIGFKVKVESCKMYDFSQKKWVENIGNTSFNY